MTMLTNTTAMFATHDRSPHDRARAESAGARTGGRTVPSSDLRCANASMGERLVALVTGRCSETGKRMSEVGL